MTDDECLMVPARKPTVRRFRCVRGSDFPCELWCPRISYAQHLRIFTHELGLKPATKKAVLGETAYQLWFRES